MGWGGGGAGGRKERLKGVGGEGSEKERCMRIQLFQTIFTRNLSDFWLSKTGERVWGLFLAL